MDMSLAPRPRSRPRLRLVAVACALFLSLTLVAARAANTVTQVVTAGTRSASVADLTLSPVSYSTADQISVGTLTLTVDDQSGTAAGWSATLQVSDFAYTGASSGVDIPASNFAITSLGNPNATTGQAVDAAGGPRTPVAGATGPLNVARTVLLADAGYGQGSYTQALDVQLTIPGGSVAGAYTGSFTVTVGAAP